MRAHEVVPFGREPRATKSGQNFTDNNGFVPLVGHDFFVVPIYAMPMLPHEVRLVVGLSEHQATRHGE